MRNKPWLLIVGVVCAVAVASGTARAAAMQVGGSTIRRDSFNLKFDLTIPQQATANAFGEIYFHADRAGNGYLLKMLPGKLSLGANQKNTFTPIAEAEVAPTDKAALLIKRRPESISVFVDHRKLLSIDKPEFEGGMFAWRSDGGIVVADGQLQNVGEVYFTDEFMRETRSTGSTTQRIEDHGLWNPSGGKWSILGPGRPDTSAAIFQLCYSGNERGAYTTGYWFWENYIYAASFCLEAETDTAAMVFYQYQNGRYILEWDGQAGSLKLVADIDGERQVLDSKKIGFVPNEWYRAKILVEAGQVRVYIDDNPIFHNTLPGAVCGSIGLEAQGADVRFDDIQVLSLKIGPKDFAADDSQKLLASLQNAESVEHITSFFSGRPTMKNWSTAEGAWHESDGIEWNDSIYYTGSLTWKPTEKSTRGTAALVVAPAKETPEKSIRLICSFDTTGQTPWTQLSLIKDGKLLKTAVEKAVPEAMRIDVSKSQIMVSVSDVMLLDEPRSAEYKSFSFGRVARGDVEKSFAVSTENILDYPFTRSPNDWITSGIWELRPRWSCDPKFNWFSGRNPNGYAELWNKNRFEGDYTVEAYVAAMLHEESFPRGYHFPISFRVTVAADEMKPGSGYTCIYGYVDRPTEILRDGQVVASDTSEVDATLYKDAPSSRAEQIHRRWTHIKIQKKGSEVRFYLDGRLKLKFNDPQPLNGPYFCISTKDNGIMVSRVKVTYETKNGKTLVTR